MNGSAPALTIECGAAEENGRRLVVARLGDKHHRHKFDTDSQYHRGQFREAVIAKFALGEDANEFIESRIVAAADAEDESASHQWATPNVVTLRGIDAKPIHWFWDNTWPAGALIDLVGDPNEGKSQVALSIAARYSRGETMPPTCFPGGARGNTLLLSAEDDLERTTIPRLLEQGADMSRIHHLRTVRPWNCEADRMVEIPTDIAILESIVAEKKVGLMVLDVLSAFIAEGFNMNGDGDMRRALSPLTAMAERQQLTILSLRHMNKKEGVRSMYRAGGSVAIVAAARAAFAVAPHPDDPSEKVFAAIKHNLGPKPPSLTYRIEPAGNVSRVVWGGQTELSAADVLGSQAGNKGGHGGDKTERAKEIIATILADGSRGSNEVMQACMDAGLSPRTYHTARKALGVKSERTGFGRDGQWLLTMPANGYAQDDF